MKTLLVHGYATKLRASIFRTPLPQHEGFIALKHEIASDEVHVFHWGIGRILSFAQSLNPISYLKLYRDEERLAESLELQRNLFDTIASSKIEQIICHSMGCRLLLNMMNTIGLPHTVKSVIFLQADIDAGVTLQTPITQAVFQNYFCSWDQSLIASSILHRKLRVGIRPWKHAGVTNHFFPLLRPINLHTSPLRDRAFLQSMISI